MRTGRRARPALPLLGPYAQALPAVAVPCVAASWKRRASGRPPRATGRERRWQYSYFPTAPMHWMIVYSFMQPWYSFESLAYLLHPSCLFFPALSLFDFSAAIAG